MSKQQIVIVEGLDMVGKTTILTELSQQTGIPVYKEVREEKWYDHCIDLLYAEEARLQMVQQLKLDIIFDRSYPSEYAYAHAYGRNTVNSRILELDKRYAQLGAKILYLYKRTESWQKDKTNLIDYAKYQLISGYYEEFFQLCVCPIFKLDTTNENLEEQMTVIKSWMER